MGIIIILAIIALDQITKHWAANHLQQKGTMVVIKDIFSFTYVENRGAAFGILQNQRWLFIGLTIIVCIGMVYYLYTNQDFNLIMKLGLYFILGGAIGNLIDRIYNGYVVDMFHFTFINFPVFNVADCFVVIGTIILASYILFVEGRVIE
ncbi:MAG: signal peptidase II [Clostridiales bacterium]|nr:signal peptidase II [Clostridiales bacterium]